MQYCEDCGSPVDESDQSNQDYKDGICPYCGGSNVIEPKEEPGEVR